MRGILEVEEAMGPMSLTQRNWQSRHMEREARGTEAPHPADKASTENSERNDDNDRIVWL